MTGRASDALLAVVFASGERPSLANLDAWRPIASMRGFSITHSAQDGTLVWAELLANGLAFDCSGLADGAAAAFPAAGPRLGLERIPLGETLTLAPGPHIVSGANLPPVVRALIGLGAEFAAMPGAAAVCWLPSGCWMAPAYFVRIAEDWLAGGAFPALGLTMLNRLADGRIETQGLKFFIGQEIELPAEVALSADRMAQIGIRLINELIVRGPLAETHAFAFDGFAPIKVEPSPDGRILKVAFLADAG